MANPFSKHLSRKLSDHELLLLVDYWDRLEALVTTIHRNGSVGPADPAEYDSVWTWLRTAYPTWRKALEPYWKQSRIGGQPCREDPFARLLASNSASDYIGSWIDMQYLPAAREALNLYLMSRTDRDVER